MLLSHLVSVRLTLHVLALPIYTRDTSTATSVYPRVFTPAAAEFHVENFPSYLFI